MRYIVRALIIRAVTRLWVTWLYAQLRIRLARYQAQQLALARRYRVNEYEPESYGDAMRAKILGAAAAAEGPATFAWTSGTTSQPKQLFYPRQRTWALQRTHLEQALLAYDAIRIRRLAIYLLTSMARDRSLSGLLSKRPLPAVVDWYVLGDSIIHMPAAADLVGRYSQEALHLALMVVSAPTIIGTVNPSSLVVLLETAQRNWPRISGELRGILEERLIHDLCRKLGPPMRQREARLRELSNRPVWPPIRELIPDLRAIYCWDGGYVRPFIDKLRMQLVELNPVFVPLFSHSTETVAYEIFPRLNGAGGLPIYPRVCYEFVSADEQPGASRILKPWELKAEQQYVMLVSDAYGLRRYRTDDVFICLGCLRHTPVLRFVARAGLGYSFTGEKITAEQLEEVYERIRRHFGDPGMVFTCFPTLNGGGVPGYVFVCCSEHNGTLHSELVPEIFDRLLTEINEEYAAKRATGRLATPQLTTASYQSLMSMITSSNHRFQRSSLAQFKLLPLYKMFWEQVSRTSEESTRHG